MLGDEVPFLYCRTQEGNRLCPRILDCWWETFDICGFLKANLTEAQFTALASPSPRPPKLVTLSDLIAQAKARVAQEKGE
jgi:hypothetical protein